MTQPLHLARCATVAIAAALVLGSTPLLAQDADPAATTVVPDVAAPAAPAPVTITPTVAPAPAPAAPTVVSHPVVQQVPPPVTAADEPATPAPAAAKPAPTRAPAAKTVTRTTTQTSTRAAPAPAANDVAPPSDAAEVLPPAPVVADQSPPAGETGQSATVTRSNPALLSLIVLGGLVILVLAILAVIYRRFARRDRTARAAAPMVTPNRAPIQRPEPAAVPAAPAVPPEIAAVTAPSAGAATPEASSRAEPVRSEPIPIRRQTVSFGSTGRPATPGALPSAGAAVDLPARVPEDFDERSALLARMIAARPDKANPFTNRKARAKRARLILQSLGRKFEHAYPRIDLSQYPNNWPELARRYSQAA